MTLDSAGRAPAVHQRWWFRPVIGIVLLAVILTAAPIYGRVTAGGKIDPGVSRTAPTVNVIVDLTTDVGNFHQNTLADFGVFGGRDRNSLSDRSRVRLQNVTQDRLDALTRIYWVEKIEPA